MDRVTKGITAASILILASGIATMALSEESGQSTKGVNAFRACYETSIAKGVVGAPILNIKVVVSEDNKTAEGTATVKWGSVGPAFKDFESPIRGPWYFMCTTKSCKIRFDFESAPGAKGVKGMLVSDNWGSPGTFEYEFAGGAGVVKQDAAVCN